MAAPAFETVAGARLNFVAAPAAPRSTRLAANSMTLRTPELGWSGTGAQNQGLRQAEADFTGNGVRLAAGVTHVWDLPDGLWDASGKGPSINITGSSAIRITCLDLAGSILTDQELVNSKPTSFSLPPRTAMLAVLCLGNPAASLNIAGRGFGRVSAAAAPSGDLPVVGWQAANLLFQAAPSTLLARGAAVILSHSSTPLRGRQMTTQATIRAAEATAGSTGVETWLPPYIGVVMILLDQKDPSAADNSDLSIAAQGLTLAQTPVIVSGGRRTALLYDVQKITPDLDHVSVSVASLSAWRLSGVIGLPGKAQEWAARMNGSVPEHLVPEGPLTPDGQLVVQFQSSPGGAS
jgi:hypothetical protein